RSPAQPPQDTGKPQHQLPFNSRLGVIICYDCGLEAFVIVSVFQRANDGLGCEPMPDGVAARDLLASLRCWTRTLERIALICFDLTIRGHREPARRLASFGNFDALCPSTLGSGCDFSQSTRAAALASIPVLFHHAASSPQRCTSR